MNYIALIISRASYYFLKPQNPNTAEVLTVNKQYQNDTAILTWETEGENNKTNAN